MSVQHSAARSGDHNARTFEDPILRPPEAARYLGLSESTLAKRRMRNEAPTFVKLTGRACGYRLSSLNRFVQANERTATVA